MLTWHHTELGRRSTCERYRILRQGDNCRLLDGEWNPLGELCPSIEAAQRLAEQIEARARRRREKVA